VGGLVTSAAAFVIVDLDYLNVEVRFHSSVLGRHPSNACKGSNFKENTALNSCANTRICLTDTSLVIESELSASVASPCEFVSKLSKYSRAEERKNGRGI